MGNVFQLFSTIYIYMKSCRVFTSIWLDKYGLLSASVYHIYVDHSVFKIVFSLRKLGRSPWIYTVRFYCFVALLRFFV